MLIAFEILRPPDIALGVSLARWMCKILAHEFSAMRLFYRVKDLHLTLYIPILLYIDALFPLPLFKLNQ